MVAAEPADLALHAALGQTRRMHLMRQVGNCGCG
jgi:hypothetical protein